MRASTQQLLDLDRKIDFGKYKGRPLDEAPTDYLLWVLKTVKLDWESRERLVRELRGRGVQFPERTINIRKW